MGISHNGNTRPVALAITGMHCGNCVARVAKALTELEGVEVEAISIGSARLRLAPGATTIPEIVAAVGQAGYTAIASAE